MYAYWREHIHQGFQRNDEMFSRILEGFMGPYDTTIWMYRILFGVGIFLFLAAVGLSAWTGDAVFGLVFGGLGVISSLGAVLSGAVVLYQKFLSASHLAMNRNPLLPLTAMLITAAIQFLLMGLLAELLVRTYHESQGRPSYSVRRIISSRQAAGEQ